MAKLISPLCLSLIALFSSGCGGSAGAYSPIPEREAWFVTPAGGTFSNGVVQLTAPEGAVTHATTVFVTPTHDTPAPPAGMVRVEGTNWNLSHRAFRTHVSLRIAFSPGSVPDDAVPSVTVYRLAPGKATWTPLTTTVDASTLTASTWVDQLSVVGLFYPSSGS